VRAFVAETVDKKRTGASAPILSSCHAVMLQRTAAEPANVFFSRKDTGPAAIAYKFVEFPPLRIYISLPRDGRERNRHYMTIYVRLSKVTERYYFSVTLNTCRSTQY
jgi:hypothetical protein